MTVPWMPTAPAPPKRWPVAVAFLALGLAAGAGGVLLGQRVLTPDAATSSGNALQAAHDSCHVGDVGDGGKTIIMGTAGERGGVGDSVQGITCVLNAVGAPDSVRSKMEQTRALDGRQSAQWGAFEASWTYDPDTGLDIVLTEQ